MNPFVFFNANGFQQSNPPTRGTLKGLSVELTTEEIARIGAQEGELEAMLRREAAEEQSMVEDTDPEIPDPRSPVLVTGWTFQVRKPQQSHGSLQALPPEPVIGQEHASGYGCWRLAKKTGGHSTVLQREHGCTGHHSSWCRGCYE
jgi:hypothetical protein